MFTFVLTGVLTVAVYRSPGRIKGRSFKERLFDCFFGTKVESKRCCELWDQLFLNISHLHNPSIAAVFVTLCFSQSLKSSSRVRCLCLLLQNKISRRRMLLERGELFEHDVITQPTHKHIVGIEHKSSQTLFHNEQQTKLRVVGYEFASTRLSCRIKHSERDVSALTGRNQDETRLNRHLVCVVQEIRDFTSHLT